MQQEVKIERVPWIPIVILTLVFGFFGPVYASIQPNGTWYALGRIACNLVIMVMPLFFIMGAAVVGKLLGKPISLATYTFLYAAGTGLVMASSYVSFPIGSPFTEIQFDRIGISAEINPWPLFMSPSAEIMGPILTGGAPVPWGDWMPVFIWWWSLFGGCAIFSLGQGVIWRRRWIDMEKVPFPHTQVAAELVARATSSEKSFKVRMGLPYLLGLVLGIAFQVPLLLAYLYPWFPDVYGWRTNTCTMGTQYILSDSPLAGIVGMSQFNKDPAVAAIFYLAPLNVIFGAWFWYLIFSILMQIAFTMGYYTGITGYAGCGRVWCGVTGYRVGDPFKWDVFSTAGVSTGISLAYIALNWNYLAETFNAAIGRLSKDKMEQFDRTEPTSYRNAYAMTLASALLIVVVFMVAGVGLPAALLLILTSVIVTLVATRSYSLVGFAVPAGSTFYYGPMKMLLSGGANPNREWYVGMGFTYTMTNPLQGGEATFPLTTSLASYQLANINKVSTKHVFKIQLFVCGLTPLISVAGAIWGFYTFGVQKLPSVPWYSWRDGLTPDAVANRPAYEPWWPQMVAGMAFAVILSFMHARFVWFPLEPIGFLLATDGHAMIEGIWTMALVAWVLKTVTLRVGGSKLYERTGVPTAMGFVVGIVIVSIIGGLLLLIRFFYPF